jgi:hypothetical protein
VRASCAQGWKKPGFVFKKPGFLKPGLKKNQPSGFFWFFWFFCVFWGFWVSLGFLNIFAQKREFLGFFQFQEYF